MVDERIKEAAKILVDYSTRIKKGEYVQILGGYEARNMIKEVYKLVLKRGAYPKMNLSLSGTEYIYYKNVSLKQIKKFPEIAMHEMEKTDAIIFIGAPENLKELTNVDHKKIALRDKITRKVTEERLKKKWVLFAYPTNARAQEAGMSLEEYEDFVFGATNLDWSKEGKKQEKLKGVLDKGDKVRIIGNDTDIRFSIKGRTAVKGDGEFNMPDGEVFTAPVDGSAEGYIRYEFPAIYCGVEVEDVRLEFKKGVITKISATKNEKYLRSMINMDKGSNKLGEFGVGVNPKITKFTKNGLYDEKIFGTIHLALGNAYKECGGKNESGLHWDMIKDLRNNGKIIIDGKIIQKNGKWLI